jgi:hypothetical protein
MVNGKSTVIILILFLLPCIHGNTFAADRDKSYDKRLEMLIKLQEERIKQLEKRQQEIINKLEAEQEERIKRLKNEHRTRIEKLKNEQKEKVKKTGSEGIEVFRKGDMSLKMGLWGQAWYQYISDYDTDETGEWDDDLNDFMVRRTYFYVKGTVTPWMDFFVHYAGDRLGQEDLDVSSKGLGTSLALRDGWARFKLLDDDFMLQMGRMYVPFTRNYGTTSTKSMLTADLDWGQGGYRSGIFYPQNVGRDDSITLWGNVLKDQLQYRVMVGEGTEDSDKNPDDNPRIAARLSYNFFDPETKWFNAGTYLGKKQILALGLGIDYQKDLILNNKEDDYIAWTADIHFDQPLSQGALTCQASYIDIDNTVNGISWTQIASGDDGQIYSGKTGYYFSQKIGPGRLQPYVHYQYFDPDESSKDATNFYGLGLNYYLKGPGNKLTLEVSYMDQEEEFENSSIKDHTMFIFQTAFGF